MKKIRPSFIPWRTPDFTFAQFETDSPGLPSVYGRKENYISTESGKCACTAMIICFKIKSSNLSDRKLEYMQFFTRNYFFCLNKKLVQHASYTGCIKKKVIELQRAIIRESLGVWTIDFHIRKDQACIVIEWHAFHTKWRKNKHVRGRLKMLVKITYFHLCITKEKAINHERVVA
jgi:hypothetical protein